MNSTLGDDALPNNIRPQTDSIETRQRRVQESQTICKSILEQTKEARIAALHAGKLTATDDFDEPLPDEFWTGD